ncbi:MAG: tungstate ABC transporter substrate-binding protein WtpA [Deltaproteobacteria bacterium]|nr:tungstate ABC transporter substrate-binding protein WtpA [Deltaproteobacteria bacterium]
MKFASVRVTAVVLSLLLWPAFFAAGPAAAEPGSKVVIFHAGSLTVPLAAMEKAFEAAHPDIDILREAGGSRQCARKITDLHQPCDIMASADFSVIDRMLIPGNASWNIRFATNQMVLCYTDRSAFAQEIGPETWTDILGRKEVVWGHSDPNLDPCGYRALMVIQLAEKAFSMPGLYQRLLANRPLANVRPKAVELVAMLENGGMDYAWEYRSVAVQHKLKFVSMPDQINLSSYALDPFYQQAKVEISGKRPGEKIELSGKSITYGVTLLDQAPNRAAAILFLDYLLDPAGGMKILAEMGQPPIVPARVTTAEVLKSMPAPLKARVVADH